MFTVGSLFSGYGGLELGLECTGGFDTVWHCEIEPYPAAVLAERWPGVPNLGDITKVNWAEVPRVDVLCGGFPCQDISSAGKRKGIVKGETRSGLWGEFHKAIRILRPQFVLIENVSDLASLGLDIVLADLAKEGYDAEWIDLRACDFGAPHKRERIFIVAYTNAYSGRYVLRGFEEQSAEGGELAQRDSGSICSDVPNADHGLRELSKEKVFSRRSESKSCSYVSYPCCKGFQGQQQPIRSEKTYSVQGEHGGWETECGLDRVVYGLARGLDLFIWRERIKALGNGVVPQVSSWVGRQIIKAVEDGL